MNHVPLDDEAPETVPLFELPEGIHEAIVAEYEVLSEDEPAFTGALPDWDDEIGVYLDNGTKLFSIDSSGEVYVHDHDCLPEAAVIFFRQVAEVAELQGWKVDRASDRHGSDG